MAKQELGDRSSSEVDSRSSKCALEDTPPSSPPSVDDSEEIVDKRLAQEEERARSANLAAAARKKKPRKAITEAQREAKVKDLEELLAQCEHFRTSLTERSGMSASLEGKSTLGQHNLEMAKQPKCMVGGKMRDYQLEGLTWMYQVCEQGLSGILADEMGLGKTCQTISLIARLREQDKWYGPHLIVAPLSTLANWVNEFQFWTPSIPVVMYHGTIKEREGILRAKIMPHLKGGKPTTKFPVVCTSYEMIIKDQTALSKIQWESILVDEGHRLKNANTRLFQIISQFRSATRFLITGTPLQNDLKELWSLLHFLLPTIFTDWEAFDTWFNFSELEDEEGTKRLLGDARQQDLLKKMHFILQPLLLRRVKADVAKYLPPKREYILYAPMTKEQTDLYNALADKNTDNRAYLEQQVVKRLSAQDTQDSSSLSTPFSSRPSTANLPDRTKSSRTAKDNTKTNIDVAKEQPEAVIKDEELLVGKRGRGRPKKSATPAAPAKRKAAEEAASPPAKTPKTSGSSTPAGVRSSGRRRTVRNNYKEAESDDELSDDQFEAKLARQLEKEAQDLRENEPLMTPAEAERAKTLELAKREISKKKLGNPMMQLRLACNSPHNFYNAWATDDQINESIVTSSGKMLLLDRLLPALIDGGHKVLIFSQFKTQLDILEDYCFLRHHKVCRLDGSVQLISRQSQIEEFNKDPELRIFLLSTRAGGQGINLASADTVILFDSDWNPQQDLQAQDRAHRLGQKRPVVVFRLATRGTVEEVLLGSADAKRRLEKLIIKKGGYKNLSQKMADLDADLDDEDVLESLLLKDGQVYETSGGEQVLSDEDLELLLDRSEAAYKRAATGEGNAAGFTVVETGTDGMKTIQSKA